MTTFIVHERGTPAYDAALAGLERRGESDLLRVEPEVRAILDDVRARGDAALVTLTRRFEGRWLWVVCRDFPGSGGGSRRQRSSHSFWP